MIYRLSRDVTRAECPWLDADVPAGRLVTECERATYNLIGWTGVACTFNECGDYPFFELPMEALEVVGP